VTVSGPYGTSPATQRTRCASSRRGGMAPMRSPSSSAAAHEVRRRMTFWYSTRNLSEAFYVDEFDRAKGT
jgi:Na+-transporting NADH:ubiquinone oxidoreductase subunit NqrF